MVQQIASVKTESAASVLPFTLSASALSVQNETRQSFDNELFRQSNASNVYEQTQHPYKTDASRNSHQESQKFTAQNRNNDRDLASQRQAKAIQKQNKVNEQANARIDEQRAQRQEDIDDAKKLAMQQSRSSSSQYSSTSSDYEHTVAASKGLTTLKDKTIDNADTSEVMLERQQSNSAETSAKVNSEEASLHQSDSIKEQFDYIDYVTQLAEFTGSNVEENRVNQGKLYDVDKNNEHSVLLTNTETTNAHVMPETMFDKINANSNAEPHTNTENTEVKINIPSNLLDKTLAGKELESASTTVSLNVSSQDLSIIRDIQQAQLANDKNLSTQEQLELSRIVDDLINQFNSLNGDSSSAGDGDFSEADKALFTELLLTQSSQDKASLKGIVDDQAMPSRIAPLLVNEDSFKETIEQNELTLMQHGKAAISASILDEKLVSTELKNDKANVKQETIVETGDSKSSKDNKKLDGLGGSLRNLTELNEEQSKLALESLSARVQAVASDISGEGKGKGNEFIAALQSGVKEFKQQLSQGREPSIDLKAIVAEALAQISGESTVQQQPKIDAVINQFNAVLNLANAVNHSASQQLTSVVEITDTQLAKEFNLQHIEGTKLANGIQNQLNAQASADKAINIFKHEGQQQLAEKVRWMVNAKSATAEIRLDPPDLGGINIKINISGDTAQVNFNVQSAAAKEALDQAAPRLREMLQEQGIELGESVVQQDSQKGDQGEPSNNGENLAQGIGAQLDSEQIITEENTSHVIEQRVSGNVLGGIDYYA